MKVVEIFEVMGQFCDFIKLIGACAELYPDEAIQEKWCQDIARLKGKIDQIKAICAKHPLPKGAVLTQLNTNIPFSKKLRREIDEILQGLLADEILGADFKNAQHIRHVLADFFIKENMFIAKCHDIPFAEMKALIENILVEQHDKISLEEKRELVHLLSFINKYKMIDPSTQTKLEDFYHFVTEPEGAFYRFLCFMKQAQSQDNLVREQEFYIANYASRLQLEVLATLVKTPQEEKTLAAMGVLTSPLCQSLRFHSFLPASELSSFVENISKYFSTMSADEDKEQHNKAFAELLSIIEHINIRFKKLNNDLKKRESNFRRIRLNLKRKQLDKYHEVLYPKDKLHRARHFFEASHKMDEQLTQAAIDGDLDALKSALAQGAWINAHCKQKKFPADTPLVLACRHGHRFIVAELIQRFHADRERYPLDFRSEHLFSRKRKNALHWAAMNGHHQVVALVFTVDPELVYRQDDQGNTPLHLAIEQGHNAVVDIICQFCMVSLFETRNNEGKTPFMKAFDLKNKTIIQTMINYMSELSDNDTVLKDANAYVTQQSKGKRTLIGLLLGRVPELEQELLTASYQGNLPKVKEVIETKGANTLVRDVGKRWGNFTIMHHAADRGHSHLIEYFLSLDRAKHPIHLLAQTRFDNRHTALHLAAKKGFLTAVHLLYAAESQALYVREAFHGNTPLHLAVAYNHLAVVKFFVEKEGLHILDVTMSDGVTNAFRLAINLRRWDIVQYLLEKIKTFKTIAPAFYHEALGYLAVFSHFDDNIAAIAGGVETVKKWQLATKEDIIVTRAILILTLHEDNLEMSDFLCGGNLAICDDRYFYHEWMTMENKTNRQAPGMSTHLSLDPQHSVQGTFIPEFLWGTRMEKGKIHTWLQAERYPVSLKHVAGHVVTSVLYGVIQRNIGPYGTSPYTDSAAWRSTTEYDNQMNMYEKLEQHVEQWLGRVSSRSLVIPRA